MKKTLEHVNKMSLSSKKSGRFDEYGFERCDDFDSESHDAFLNDYLPVLVRRARRWDEEADSLTSEDVLAASKGSRKLKRFVRKGIPGDRRAGAWMALSGAESMRRNAPEEYREMSFNRIVNKSTADQIETDLNRTFPNNVFFSSDDPSNMQKSLFNVLVAFANRNPDVGYCQGLNYVAGLLLIVTRDEEMSYFLLRALAEKILPDYYEPTIRGLRADVRVFAELVRQKCADVYAKVEALRMPWELICSKWLVCLYTDVLPVETVLRVWDCLFHEGSKILLRVAVALVMRNRKRICEAEDFTELVARFREFDAVNCHDFINSVFETSGHMSNKAISRLRLKFEAEIHKEQLERDQKRKKRN